MPRTVHLDIDNTITDILRAISNSLDHFRDAAFIFKTINELLEILAPILVPRGQKSESGMHLQFVNCLRRTKVVPRVPSGARRAVSHNWAVVTGSRLSAGALPDMWSLSGKVAGTMDAHRGPTSVRGTALDAKRAVG
jgi:hypothetical protein